MEGHCKITVVTVCLNSAVSIEKAIESVVGQDYGNVEYIIIDGGSTDGTVEIIKKYASHISSWISEPDRGIYQAMNKGIKRATGDLIGFLSSNDWYADGALRAVAEKFIETQADVVYGDAVILNNGELKWEDHSKARMEDSYYYMPVIHPAMFVRTAIQQKYGFDETYRIAADYKFFMQVYRDGCRFAHTGHDVIYFNLGGISSESVQTAVESRRASYETVGLQREKYREGIERRIFETLYGRLDVFLKNGFGRAWIRRNIDVEEDIYIWGAGYRGKHAYFYLQDATLKIAGFLDNAEEKRGTGYLGRQVFGPGDIPGFGHGIIFISSYDYADEIEGQLACMELGSRYKVLRADLFFANMVSDYIAALDARTVFP